jgi:hypothetical protein
MISTDLVLMLQKYVAHKASIAKSSLHYRKLSFIAPLERCQTLVHRMKEVKDDKAAAGLILNRYRDLTKILPSPRNVSYNSSYEKLQQLAFKCNEILTHINHPIH